MSMIFRDNNSGHPYKSAAHANIASVVVNVQSYACASRRDIGLLATIYRNARKTIGA
jgi:hypothetical protein